MKRALRSIGPVALATTLTLVPLASAEETVSERTRVGQTAPDFTLPDPEGANHTLSALQGEKNVLLVFFRGAW